MKKISIILSTICTLFIGISLAAPSIINPSYSVNGNDVKIYRTDNSDGGYMDISLQDPKTQDRLHYGEVKMSDQVFTYVKQRDGDQNVWMIPGDGGDDVKFTITSDNTPNVAITNESATQKTEDKPAVTRTVIPVVPRTGPSWSLIGIILSTLVIFGGYIYIKKRANI